MSKHKLKSGDITDFGRVQSVDVCTLCTYEGSCDKATHEFCFVNLRPEQYFTKI